MSSFQPVWRSLGLLVVGFAVLSGCDIPTGEPSLNTEVGISGPVVAAKTYSFIGGPDSENDPLIDTTAVKNKSILRTIERTPGAKNGAERKLAVNQGFSEVLVSEDDPITKQKVRAETSLSLQSSSSSSLSKAMSEPVTASGTININSGDPDNAEFKAIDPDDESSLTIEVKNDASFTLEDVNVTLENNANAASEFDDVTINNLGVAKSFGTLSPSPPGESASRTIDDWENRAIKEAVDVTVTATATGSPSLSDKITVCLGGSDCISSGTDGTLTVQTLYFISGDESFTTSGSFDLFNDSGRFDFGSNTFITLPSPRLSVEDLNIEGSPADPRFLLESFRLRYKDNLTFASGSRAGSPFEVDLVTESKNFDGNAVSCPCTPTVSLDETVKFSDLGSAESVDFELTADLKADEPSILNVGDAVTATSAGFPTAEMITVNWGRTGNAPEKVTVKDTSEADLSGLDDLTDPDNNVRLEDASLQFSYTNSLPLGGDLTLQVLDENGDIVRTLEPVDDSKELRIAPVPKTSDGTADGSVTQTLSLKLGDDRAALRELAEGTDLRLVIDMTQKQDGPNATLRAKDTLKFNLTIDANTSIDTDR